MFSFFQQGGVFMWPLLLIAIVLIYLSVKKTVDIFFKKNLSRDELKRGINTILFWGCFSMVLGVFAHFYGVYLAMQAIMKANDISPAIVARGYSLSLITMITGLVIFIISALVWIFLKWKCNKLISGTHDDV